MSGHSVRKLSYWRGEKVVREVDRPSCAKPWCHVIKKLTRVAGAERKGKVSFGADPPGYMGPA